MSEPFVGQITMFAGNFAPRGWAFCDGQVLSIPQNDALFSLFGTIYGGDGKTTFRLPDLRGRAPIHPGSGPGLSARGLGEKSGQENVTLTVNQLPSHTHTFSASSSSGTKPDPAGNVLGSSPNVRIFRDSPGVDRALASNAMLASGGSRDHTNLMPCLCVHFIVALVGIYPSRN